MGIAARDSTVEYLTTTKIGEKGQLTVPKEFRDSLGLETGAPFAVLRLGDGLLLLPQQREFETLCQRISAALGGAGLSAAAILKTLPLARRLRSNADPAHDVTERRRLRLFLDSNVLIGGIAMRGQSAPRPEVASWIRRSNCSVTTGG